MYNIAEYANGVYGILNARWKVICETPLVIRNGVRITQVKPDESKNRNVNNWFAWRERNEEKKLESEVTSLNFGYEVVNGKVRPYYKIPASSVRGSLRSWTINHLVHPDFLDVSMPAMTNEAAIKAELVGRALADPKSGYQVVASLFGQALNTEGEDNLSLAGRLAVTIKDLSGQVAKPFSFNGITDGSKEFNGPKNARQQVTVRNPLDRVTHASKEGALHQFMEFCKGETFSINLKIANPRPADLGFLSVLYREINAGMLRFGALSSIGRGRVKIEESSKCDLWLANYFDKSIFGSIHPNSERQSDILSELWEQYEIPLTSLTGYEQYLENELRGSHGA